MARINGVNSDYIWSDGDGGVIENSSPGDLFLKLFICPYEQPSSLEALNGASDRCSGTDTDCPNAGPVTGHAMIHLHQVDGIELMTDNGNRLSIDQSGNILFQPNTATEAHGNFTVKTSNGITALLTVTQNQITIQTSGGAKIDLKSNGSVDINTSGGSGTITLTGNVHVTGNMTVDGTLA